MKKLYEVLVVVTIIVIALVFRGYKLTTNPPGFYTDESSIAYNAWSVVTTGKDEHAKPWPLFFEAYGEFKLPVYIYSVAFWQFLLGPHDVTVRLPAYIYGVGTVLFMYLFVKELLQRANVSEFVKTWGPGTVALLLAFSPWHFQFSRPGFEASSALFFQVLGLWLFFKAMSSQKFIYLLLAMMAFVATLYAYNSSRIVTPLILGVLFLFFLRRLPFWQWVVAFAFALIIATPFISFARSGPGLIRAHMVSIVYKDEYKDKLFQTFMTNYLQNISPMYLFQKGDPTIAHMTPHRWGLHYFVELPFFFLGFVIILLKRNRELLLGLILGLVGLIPPSLSVGNPHALRGVLAVVGTVFISGLGTIWVVSLLKKRGLRLGFALIYSGVLAVLVVRFLITYHAKYPLTAIRDWQVDIKLMTEAVAERESAYDQVYFRGIHREAVLWDLRIPPAVFISAKDKNILGKFHFNVKSHDVVSRTGRSLYVTDDEKVDRGRLIYMVTLPNGDKGHRLWEL